MNIKTFISSNLLIFSCAVFLAVSVFAPVASYMAALLMPNAAIKIVITDKNPDSAAYDLIIYGSGVGLWQKYFKQPESAIILHVTG